MTSERKFFVSTLISLKEYFGSLLSKINPSWTKGSDFMRVGGSQKANFEKEPPFFLNLQDAVQIIQRRTSVEL